MPDDLLYKVALEMLPKVGGVTAKRLMSYCGDAKAVFKTPKQQLLKIPNISATVIQGILNAESLKRAEQELEFVQQHRLSILFYTDEQYPKRLLACDDGPTVLFMKGTTDLNTNKTISIVGTRAMTSYGTALCEKLLADMADKGYTPLVISGLAYGVDICAHKAALANKLDTVAVLGTGLNKVYPAAHRAMAQQIEQHGALISEFPSDASIVPGNFLSRNRIVAGMADALVVVESSSKGGALVTAEIACSYNRDVAAFPGRVGDEYSAGCNALIKRNKAAMIESFADLEYLLGWSTKQQAKPQQLQLFCEITEAEQTILSVLKGTESLSIDTIAYTTGFPMPELSALLLNLEFAGYVNVLPGKAYSLKRI